MHELERQLFLAVEARDEDRVRTVMGKVLALYGEEISGDYVYIAATDLYAQKNSWLNESYDTQRMQYVVRGTKKMIIEIIRTPRGRTVELAPVGITPRENLALRYDMRERGFCLKPVGRDNGTVKVIRETEVTGLTISMKRARRMRARIVSGIMCIIGAVLLSMAMQFSWPAVLLWIACALILPAFVINIAYMFVPVTRSGKSSRKGKRANRGTSALSKPPKKK